MSPSYTIETSHLRKEYSRKVAVADLDLQVGQGEVFGFLGPNGAGKTTSIKMLLGLAKPTSGEARLLGQPIGDPQSRSRVGFLPEHFRFHDWLNGAEFLNLHARLYGLAESARQQRVPALLKRVGLEEHANKKLRGYSKGMLQRIGLAQALLNRPAVVFLDEPTSGLDPIGRILVRDVIRELRAEGTTVFLNSHLLSEVEITCDRVVFIKQGAVIKTITLKEIEQGATPVQIRIGAAKIDRATLALGLGQFGTEARVDSDCIHLTVADQQKLPDLVRWLIGQGLDLYELKPQRVSLEEMFLQIVGMDGGL
ncbi:putative ABC transporter ATP-binding protein YxlF [Thermoflexales bacterium]|nr:putative ABC transporter ATP-binding protein YxlF [Thermoflexales bacterium]